MASLISFNPIEWITRLGQNNATGGNAAVESAGGSASKVAQAQNGLSGGTLSLPLFTSKEAQTGNFKTNRVDDGSRGGTDAVPLSRQGLVQIVPADTTSTGRTWVDYVNDDTFMEPFAAALENMRKRTVYVPMWDRVSVHAPSYLLGR